MYGRVRTLVVAVAWSARFGGLVGGGLIALVGLSPALQVAGGVYLITTTLPAFQKERAEMDRQRRLGAARQDEPAAQHEPGEHDPARER